MRISLRCSSPSSGIVDLEWHRWAVVLNCATFLEEAELRQWHELYHPEIKLCHPEKQQQQQQVFGFCQPQNEQSSLMTTADVKHTQQTWTADNSPNQSQPNHQSAFAVNHRSNKSMYWLIAVTPIGISINANHRCAFFVLLHLHYKSMLNKITLTLLQPLINSIPYCVPWYHDCHSCTCTSKYACIDKQHSTQPRPHCPPPLELKFVH